MYYTSVWIVCVCIWDVAGRHFVSIFCVKLLTLEMVNHNANSTRPFWRKISLFKVGRVHHVGHSFVGYFPSALRLIEKWCFFLSFCIVGRVAIILVTWKGENDSLFLFTIHSAGWKVYSLTFTRVMPSPKHEQCNRICPGKEMKKGETETEGKWWCERDRKREYESEREEREKCKAHQARCTWVAPMHQILLNWRHIWLNMIIQWIFCSRFFFVRIQRERSATE